MTRVTALICCGLTACSLDSQIRHETGTTLTQVEEKVHDTQQTVRSRVRVFDDIFVAGEVVDVPMALPSELTQKVFYRSDKLTPLADIALMISLQSGIPIDNDINKSLLLNFEGTIQQWCDIIAQMTQGHCRYHAGRLSLSLSQTQTFSLAELPGRGDHEAYLSVMSGSSGSTAGAGASPAAGSASEPAAGSGVQTHQTVGLDPWAEIKAAAVLIAGPNAKVSVNQALGSITVTGSRSDIARMAEWVSDLNAALTTQIELEMQVFNIVMTHEDNYGVVPTIALQKALRGAQFNLQGGTTPASINSQSPSMASLSILGSSGGNSRWQGSKALVNALSTLGRVNTVMDKTELTKSGHPVLSHVGTSQNYVASSSSLATANVGTSVSLNASTLSTGFNTFLLPKLIGKDIHLVVSLSSSNLVRMDQFTSGSVSVQEPMVNATHLQDEVILKPGQALLLTALDSTNNQSSHSGTGSVINPLLGGGFDASRQRSLLAVCITAHVVH